MAPITEHMIRRRAEHNEGLLATLEEVALHQQSIERIELLGRLCPRLRILYLQNNLISKIENLHKLKDLSYLNLALNNITKVQNLQRCESLAKLDLTANFIPKAGLLSLASLEVSYALRELFLVGNPCADWPGYRQYVLGVLPQLTRLDGKAVTPSERIAAAQAAPSLAARLRDELAGEGIDVDAAALDWEDEGGGGEGGEVGETGTVGEDGQLRRPWCPATRILEHREQERAEREAEEIKAAARQDPFAPPPPPPRHEDFPPVPEGTLPMQRNEGKWEFSLTESDDGSELVLEVKVGRHLDTSLMRADVQPRYARLLVKGRLLQLVLPAEVRPDASIAQRSKTTGALVLRMPLEAARGAVAAAGSGGDVALSAAGGPDKPPREAAKLAAGGAASAAPLRRATVVAAGGLGEAGGGDPDALPDL
ncbi:hypothetical protein Rsub_12390 [Raphidocelis subcapitata]|uniref:Dynein axonemal assembly factor 11-like CS domain-containing protein n=1 Tax=Raphidocelis subcapitata TaxID=307507 RepID=A0A2V0PL36_9CHLO|nr:hypothetical protein Rsub_12390 [Raphidocelis subcapitata]|eukprot:GBF99762.1 hypothetical protein Rsub_12390 [Raphidocelis subcapitata]